MKLIVRNRKNNIEVSNITKTEEMVWITPEQFSQITSDAGIMAAEFMKKHPQIHEVKFSVVPELDKDEDEGQFYASEQDDEQPEEPNDNEEDGL